jgi:ankyrin repeat protein
MRADRNLIIVLKVVALLIENKADLNMFDHDGFTPLLICATHGHLACARLLVNAGSDIELSGNRGHTPLHKVTSFNGEVTFDLKCICNGVSA